MFRASTFDKLLEKSTSNLLLEPDWPVIIQICDLIRQKDVETKYVIAAIKKKLQSPNPHSAQYALTVLESIVKNCGSSVHAEVATKEFCEFLRDLSKTSPHENVRTKVLELIQTWAHAFRNQTKYCAVSDVMNIMKTDGYKFPPFNANDAMFTADTAPEWLDGTVCHRCRTEFGLIQRKHHCRNCGQVFCAQCSQHMASLPKFGIEKEVRVCDGCYDSIKMDQPKKLTTATPGSHVGADLTFNELMKGEVAKTSEPTPGKSEEQIREEEELQLALALSQSEAEEREREKKRFTTTVARGAHVTAPKDLDYHVDQSDELNRYLNRSFWEQKMNGQQQQQPGPQSPSAPNMKSERGEDVEIGKFVDTLKTQVEIFVNRMKSNASRGRSIANDTSVQTLFLNITSMHSQLLRYIQQQDDARLKYEALQDKLSQIKDARAALDALREEHRETLRREAEEAERQRQLQMAHKLEIMRKKKQEYLQYQRQLALQRVQEQEREMQLRQEQQKQQYMHMGQGGQTFGSCAPNMTMLGQGMAHGVQGGLAQGLQQGVQQGLAPGVQQGVHQGVQQGLSQGLPPGVQQGAQHGITQGVQQGLSQGVQQGLPQLPHGVPQMVHGFQPYSYPNNQMPQMMGPGFMVNQANHSAMGQINPNMAGIQGVGMHQQGVANSGMQNQAMAQQQQVNSGGSQSVEEDKQTQPVTAELISFD